MLRTTGVDGVAVARGAIGNPWIFAQARALAAGRPLPPPPSVHQQRDVVARHYRIAEAIYGPRRCIAPMRKFGIKYARLHPQPKEVRDAFVAVAAGGPMARCARQLVRPRPAGPLSANGLRSHTLHNAASISAWTSASDSIARRAASAVRAAVSRYWPNAQAAAPRTSGSRSVNPRSSAARPAAVGRTPNAMAALRSRPRRLARHSAVPRNRPRKARFVQREEGRQVDRVHGVGRLPGRFGRRLRATVPRADLLADVAAKQPRSKLRPQGRGDRPFQFNRQIADAAAGVEDIGTWKRTGGTGVEAGAAGPAMVRFRRRVVAATRRRSAAPPGRTSCRPGG